jgi:hypothetical protein
MLLLPLKMTNLGGDMSSKCTYVSYGALSWQQKVTGDKLNYCFGTLEPIIARAIFLKCLPVKHVLL